MDIRLLTTDADFTRYEHWVRSHPQGTLWQSCAWKQYQTALRRTVRVYGAWEGTRMVASALVVIDRTSFRLSTWDIPRGPLWDLGLKTQDLGEKLLNHVEKDAMKDHCLSIFFSPSIPLFLSA
mgnify:CR=1 FL=1